MITSAPCFVYSALEFWPGSKEFSGDFTKKLPAKSLCFDVPDNMVAKIGETMLGQAAAWFGPPRVLLLSLLLYCCFVHWLLAVMSKFRQLVIGDSAPAVCGAVQLNCTTHGWCSSSFTPVLYPR